MMRVLLFRDGEWWVAQCLDVDTAAQSQSRDGVIEEIQRMIYVERWLHDEDPNRPAGLDRFDELPPAPVLFLKSWNRGRHIDHRSLAVDRDPIQFEFRVDGSL